MNRSDIYRKALATAGKLVVLRALNIDAIRRMLEDVERERSTLEESYRCSADHYTPRPARLSYCEGKADILKWVLEELENEKQR
jgi:hypothetical protein